jgi:hypothetical protein
MTPESEKTENPTLFPDRVNQPQVMVKARWVSEDGAASRPTLEVHHVLYGFCGF